MPWRPLEHFRDRAVPKLNNLRRAAAAGLRVPATWWLPAAELERLHGIEPPAGLDAGPCIIRSGSPTEDQRTTSNAGQLLSLVVRQRAEFATLLRRVIEALPKTSSGARQGAVFVQPLVAAEEAGVAFFDGFYYERTQAAGSNQDLTAGQTRGEVRRGHLARDEPWSEWLRHVYQVFGEGQGRDPRLDIEFARDVGGFVLLQVRPALFPVVRNEVLTLANHKETLGDSPSPWIVSALVEAGRDLTFLEAVEPAIRQWDETYAVEMAERAWLNLSFWFRWMDHFGLPRTFATRGVGGDLGEPADSRLLPRRFAAAIPRLLRQQWLSWHKARAAERGLHRLDRQIETARGLAELYRATVAGLILALHTNYAIAGLCSALAAVRRVLRIPGGARLVTQAMMEEYGRVAALPDLQAREAGLDAWLRRYGHRGPLESDLARPRFAELREVLRRDLAASLPAAAAASSFTPRPGGGFWKGIVRPFFGMDERREWFRDATMRRWQHLRGRILAEAERLVAAGELNKPEDVFWLRGSDLQGGISLRAAMADGRERARAVDGVDLPLTGTREALRELLARTRTAGADHADRRSFPGIPLGPAVIEGQVVKAADLTALLMGDGESGGGLGPDKILVVPSLEPSWAVIFPRVGGVVAEVGGELSHASILLREARRPALVNCTGIFRQVQTGDRLRLDGARGLAELLDPPAAGR
jgi:pyruvate,water dikinase